MGSVRSRGSLPGKALTDRFSGPLAGTITSGHSRSQTCGMGAARRRSQRRTTVGALIMTDRMKADATAPVEKPTLVLLGLPRPLAGGAPDAWAPAAPRWPRRDA